MIETMGHADGRQKIAGPALPFPQRPAHFKHRHLHIFHRGQRWQQMKRLEHKANMPCPKACRIRQPAKGFTPKPNLSRIGRIERAEQMEQGGFPAAARSHQRHEFAFVNGERYPAQRLDLPVIVISVDAIHFEQNRGSTRNWRWTGHVLNGRVFLKRTGVEAQAFDQPAISAGMISS
jgi:hypothetical protein